MSDETYARGEVAQSFEVARGLAEQAIGELDRSPDHVEAGETMRRALALIAAGTTALDGGDGTAAADSLERAAELTREALKAARSCHAAAHPGGADLSMDLLDQTLGALERAAHRVRNSESRSTKFGAIRTPRAERLP